MKRESIYKRYVPAVIPPLEGGEQAICFAFGSSKLLVKAVGDKAEIPGFKGLQQHNIETIRTQYLGTLGGVHCYSAEIDPAATLPEGMDFKDLRTLYNLVEEDVFLLAGRAFQMVEWDRTNQYCGKCGTPMKTKEDERAKVCPACNLTCYPRLSPAIIVAVVKGEQILLAHAKHFRPNFYSVIAGFVEPGETFEDCVKREVMEEVGIRVKNLKYFGSQPWPFPNSLMVAFTAEYESGEITVDGVEISDADWYDKHSMPEGPTKMSVAGQLIAWFKENH